MPFVCLNTDALNIPWTLYILYHFHNNYNTVSNKIKYYSFLFTYIIYTLQYIVESAPLSLYTLCMHESTTRPASFLE